MADIKGVYFNPIKRAGKPLRWYVYAWRGGPCILKVESPTKPKLGPAELAAIVEAQKEARQVQPDLLAGLIGEWRPNSPEWKGLAATTQETWGFALDRIEEKWGKLPLELWDDPRMVREVVAWRDSRADTPRAADVGVTVLGELLKFGRLRARVLINVADGVPTIYKGADRAEIIWLPEDVAAFEKAADKRKEVVDILRLANLTGFRRADLARVTLDDVGDTVIMLTAEKKSRGRRRRAVVPLVDETVHLIEELKTRHRLPGVRNLLVNSFGRAWTPGSLTQAFNSIRDKAAIAHAEPGQEPRAKHLHDCRGTFVTKLCRCHLTDREIADIVAWSPENVSRIRRVYVDDTAVVVAIAERMKRIASADPSG